MQQLSGATMAKGVEDTAYYRYSRFIALNEVGGDPGQFGVGLAEFHALQAARQAEQPDSMTGLSTHDTKRGEDVRARLAALAEIPDEWAAFAERFLDRTAVPNRAFGYFLAQTLVGAGPIEVDRMHAYAEKAMREASDGTTWTEPDADFEAAVHAAVDLAYTDDELRRAWDELTGLVTAPGWVNALGQKLVQLTMPGVPDVYQGTEVWEDSLVDPDNRRPVDFARQRAVLAGLTGAPAVDDTGAAKLWVTAQALRARAEHPDLFRGYRPLSADGPAAEHLVAYDRGGAITLATRLTDRTGAVRRLGRHDDRTAGPGRGPADRSALLGPDPGRGGARRSPGRLAAAGLRSAGRVHVGRRHIRTRRQIGVAAARDGDRLGAPGDRLDHLEDHRPRHIALGDRRAPLVTDRRRPRPGEGHRTDVLGGLGLVDPVAVDEAICDIAASGRH